MRMSLTPSFENGLEERGSINGHNGTGRTAKHTRRRNKRNLVVITFLTCFLSCWRHIMINIYLSRRRLLRHVGLSEAWPEAVGKTLPMLTVFQTPLRLTSSEMFIAFVPALVPEAVELSTGMFMMLPLGNWICIFCPLLL